MINFKSFKWGYGLVGSLIIGLSGCYMDGHSPQNVDYTAQNTAKANTRSADAQMTGKSSSSKQVVQKTTPGPKQTAAPQIPVIQ
jgi:hypothetical protein